VVCLAADKKEEEKETEILVFVVIWESLTSLRKYLVYEDEDLFCDFTFKPCFGAEKTRERKESRNGDLGDGVLYCFAMWDIGL
jgi:hypothetical protein